MDLHTLIGEEKEAQVTKLYLYRIVYPVIVWLALYCCMSPIVWVIDNMGDCLEKIPCVGGVLGDLADCVETLADCLICVASFLVGLVISLIVGATAWLFFRPVEGAIVLGVSLCLCGSLCCLRSQRRGKTKVR